jgi:hypothetical protein
MKFISSEYDRIRPTISPEEMAIWLKEFHDKLAQALHNGEAVLDMLPDWPRCAFIFVAQRRNTA